MAMKSSAEIEIDRPGNTKLVAGTEGSPFLSDGRRMVTRAGAASELSDFDIDSVDCTGEPVEIEQRDIGGTSEVCVALNSDDDKSFGVRLQWVDDYNNVLYEDNWEKDPRLEGSDIRVDVSTAGDLFKLVIEDTSGSDKNEVSGTANAH